MPYSNRFPLGKIEIRMLAKERIDTYCNHANFFLVYFGIYLKLGSNKSPLISYISYL